MAVAPLEILLTDRADDLTLGFVVKINCEIHNITTRPLTELT